MRLVQHHLDRMSVDSTLMETPKDERVDQDCILDGAPSLRSHDKTELINKLEELEAKKEEMDAMIQRVRSCTRQDRNKYIVADKAIHND